ncbi:MAG: biotin/lipoyl-containing protein [Coriobacteriia bacterium]|nr:biotin/lipoyl-containing protein [Coriobacteriia bacterium]
MKYVITLKDKTYEVEVEHGSAMILDEYEAKAPAAAAPVAAAPVAAPAAAAAPAPAPAAAVAAGDGTPVVSPMPASVVSLNVKVGDAVAEGDVVAIVEAMKMNVEVNAPSAGTVKSVLVSVGQSVETGETLMTI